MDYYRILNVARTASSKEIKTAYFQLAKSLHPDVTGNDPTKAERFKLISEAHAVLSDVDQRREYDASCPRESFQPYDTAGMTCHPYAATGGAPDLRARPLAGLDEAVWLAHHYGPAAASRQHDRPLRSYGMHVVDEKLAHDQEQRQWHRRHVKLNRTAGYFVRREARLKTMAKEAQAKDQDDTDKSLDGCVIT